jgi:RNA polymerase sigma-70 factor (ECF subfamily)
VKLGDRYLVWRLRRNDRAACRELIDRHHAVVFGYLRGLGAQQALAEDLTQETFLQAWRSIDRLREASSLRSWLIAIARNEFLQVVRVKAVPVIDLDDTSEVVDPSGGTDTRFEQHERDRKTRHAVQQLDITLRETIALHYFEGLSLREIATITGVPAGTAKSRLNRALECLRELLEQENEHVERTSGDALAGTR